MASGYLIHTFITAVTVPLFLFASCLILPPFFIFQFIVWIVRHFSSEKMRGKVVLITGASSGIGEQMSYEYAKRGASLAIVARRENQLQKVAETARRLGSPDVLPLCADVSKADDCKRFVDETINHFGRLDHLVNNAGIFSICNVEDATDVTKFHPVMNVNFWGNIYPTHFAIPHLKKTKGKIVINSSASALLTPPRLSFYVASKAALLSFYDTLRVELAPAISITTVTLGFVDSELTRGNHLSNNGEMKVSPELLHHVIQEFPVMKSTTCANAIVDAVCRGERNVTEPKWFRLLFMCKSLCPELFQWYYCNFYFKAEKIG